MGRNVLELVAWIRHRKGCVWNGWDWWSVVLCANSSVRFKLCLAFQFCWPQCCPGALLSIVPYRCVGDELFVYVVPRLTKVQMESCLRNKLWYPPSQSYLTKDILVWITISVMCAKVVTLNCYYRFVLPRTSVGGLVSRDGDLLVCCWLLLLCDR